MKPILLNLDTNIDTHDYIEMMQGYDYTLECNLYSDGTALDLTVYNVRVEMKLGNSSFIVQTKDIAASGNKVTVILDKDFTNHSGSAALQIVISKNDRVNGSWLVNCRIKPSALGQSDDTKSKVDITKTLSNAITEAKSTKADLDASIANGNVAKIRSDVDEINNVKIPAINSQLETNTNEINYIKSNKAERSEVIVKADKSYVDTQIQSVASGSPKGVYATVSALTTAFPAGNNNIYIVSADGGWYYWNGSAWTKGGTYQASSFANYKGSFNHANSIDDFRSEGFYLCTLSQVIGTKPSGLTTPYFLLENEGIGNFIIQRAYSLISGTSYTPKIYARSWQGAWSNWVDATAQDTSIDRIYSTGDIIEGTIDIDTVNKQVITNGINIAWWENNRKPSNQTIAFTSLVINIFYNISTNLIEVYPLGNLTTITTTKNKLIFLGTYYNKKLYNIKTEHGWLIDGKSISYKETTTIPSVWNGKKANFIGDSITAGSYGNYVDTVKNILGLEVARNYGVGGGRLASTDQDSNYPPVVNRYIDMDDDADIIFMLIGTNDYASQVPIGTDTSTTITEFKGALNVVLTGLREKYPDKLIIVATQLHRYNDNQLTIKMNGYRQATKDICDKQRIVCFDLYNASGFDFTKGYYDKVLTTDGLHPNQKGADILGRKIAGFINQM